MAYVVRRISVHDYGIYLLAQSLAAFLYLLEFGTGSILVPLYVTTFTQRGIEEAGKLASTLTLTLLALGAVGSCILSLAAWQIPRLFRLPSTQTTLAIEVLIVSSVAVMFALPQGPLELLCHAFHRFDRTNQLQVVTTALRVVLTIAVLSTGGGIVSLAAVQVALSLFRLAGLWLAAPSAIPGLSLRASFHRDALADVIRASKWSFADEVSRRIGGNSEQVILGALSSFQQVALFGVSSRLPAHMYQFAARGLSVLFPTLSEHHAQSDTLRLRVTFSSALRICVTGFLPLATFGAICSGSLMRMWAGPAYERSGPVLACLLISSLSIIVMLPSDMVLYSHGQIPQAARFSIAETMGKAALALVLAARFGAVGVAAGVALWHWCVNLFLYFPAACKIAKLRPAQFWVKNLWEGAPARGLLIAVCAYVAGVAVLSIGVRLLSTLGICSLFAVTSILYCSAWALWTALPMWRNARARASAIP